MRQKLVAGKLGELLSIVTWQSAEVARQLLGRSESGGPPKAAKPLASRGQLTAAQARAVAAMLDDEIPLSVVQAPAGSGKSTVLVGAVRHLTEAGREGTVVTATTT